MNESRLLTDIDLGRVDQLVQAIKPILFGHHPIEQGAVLAQLIALWVAGHNPEVRDDLLQLFMSNVRALAEIDSKRFDAIREELLKTLRR